MSLGEILFVGTGPLLVFVWWVCRGIVMVRSGRSARAAIDPKVKAEIDVTPEWWDAEFRKLNRESNPKIPRNAPKGSAGDSGAAALSSYIEQHLETIKAMLDSQPEHTDDHEILEMRSFADQYALRYCVDCKANLPTRPDVSAVFKKL